MNWLSQLTRIGKIYRKNGVAKFSSILPHPQYHPKLPQCPLKLPSAIMLNPSAVILSEAKDLMLRVKDPSLRSG